MITLAKDGMRTDLERIWRLCFNDAPEYVNYFFDYRYNPNTCAVYVDESAGRPVAMLHMLDCSVTEDSEIIPSQYIYAAATRPDFQKRGIMEQLLGFARRYAKAKGQKYMLLVPSSRELFRYYENRGFHRCFSVRSVFMSRRDLITLSRYSGEIEGLRQRQPSLQLTDIHAVRRDMLIDREGFVTWDYKALKYAAGIHEKYGGGIVTVTDGSDAGYAFCSRKKDGSLFVSELIAHGGYDAELIKRILSAYDCDSFEFRLPVYDDFFSNFGDLVDFGMISAVSGRNPVNLLTLSGSHKPYLGLVLD